MSWARRVALLAPMGLVLLLAGCGGEPVRRGGARAAGRPEPSGTVRIAIPDRVGSVDPLLASSRSARLVARQIYEPLVAEQSGPFGQTHERPGLARALKPSSGGTIWTAQLRRGVRFQDGSSFDADAVLANADRWLATAAGRRALPALRFADSPRPGLVRFQLSGPEPLFPSRLESGRLGIVSPQALAGDLQQPIRFSQIDTGTGPFELRERDAERVLLARNSAWWGSRLALGPGVDQIEVITVPDEIGRLDQLESGSIQVADQLGPTAIRRLGRDPLLTSAGGSGGAIGFERSVRGIDSTGADQPLADLWLTTVG